MALVLLTVAVSAGCPAQPEAVDAGREGEAGPSWDAPSLGDAGTCVTNDDGDDDLFCTDRERCVEGRCVVQATFCDDGVECTIDSCSEERRRCENVAPDADDDGVRDAACLDYRGVPLGTDCDDGDPTRAPTLRAVCDAEGHDEDCNLATFGGVDVDGDGLESDACCQRDATGRLRCSADCNDAVGSANPLAPEICNGLDDDCDEIVDDIIHGNPSSTGTHHPRQRGVCAWRHAPRHDDLRCGRRRGLQRRLPGLGPASRRRSATAATTTTTRRPTRTSSASSARAACAPRPAAPRARSAATSGAATRGARRPRRATTATTTATGTSSRSVPSRPRRAP